MHKELCIVLIDYLAYAATSQAPNRLAVAEAEYPQLRFRYASGGWQSFCLEQGQRPLFSSQHEVPHSFLIQRLQNTDSSFKHVCETPGKAAPSLQARGQSR
jgi:hypothetical protein